MTGGVGIWSVTVGTCCQLGWAESTRWLTCATISKTSWDEPPSPGVGGEPTEGSKQDGRWMIETPATYVYRYARYSRCAPPSRPSSSMPAQSATSSAELSST